MGLAYLPHSGGALGDGEQEGTVTREAKVVDCVGHLHRTDLSQGRILNNADLGAARTVCTNRQGQEGCSQRSDKS